MRPSPGAQRSVDTAHLSVRHHRCAKLADPGEQGWLPPFTLGCVHHGTARVRLDGETDVTVVAGAVFLFPAGGPYRVQHQGCRRTGWCATTVSLPPSRLGFWADLERKLPLAGTLRALPLTPSALACLLLAALSEPTTDRDLDALRAAIRSAAGRTEANGRPAHRTPHEEICQPPGRRRLTDRARALLAARIARPLHLEELAAQLYCSPCHLCRAFRRETGGTLSSELRKLRVASAMLRLLFGETSLARLATDLGFASHSHFSSDFRRVVGNSPSRFRELLTGAGGSTAN
jgi:AraC-like DNA-binding protein